MDITTEVILESISDGVFTVDKDWRITSINRSAQEITGITRDEALGKLCSEVFRSSLCGIGCPLRKTMETGKAVIGVSAYFISPEGERIPISISAAVLRDEEGNIVGGVESFRDLSEVVALYQELSGQQRLGDLVSNSVKMKRLFEIIPAVAQSRSTVLIQGETGTGKEVMARTIHQQSPQAEYPFVAINCGALPDSLLESELFGYKAGAFTGAVKDKPGRFALARGGTLFLDEIGEISQAMQVRLLRVLQERVYEPLGGIESEKADVRIIAATHRDLKAMVESGEFREDLYYRINVARLELPTLAERKEDIPLLVERFIDKFNLLLHKNIQGIEVEALSLLVAYNWPGNIRELENMIERAFILCDTPLIANKHLPEELRARSGGTIDIKAQSLSPATDIIERQRILEALENNNYNRLAAATELGIHKSTFFRKIKKLGIQLPSKDGRSG